MYFCDIKSDLLFVFIKTVFDVKIRMLKLAIKAQIEFLTNFFDIENFNAQFFNSNLNLTEIYKKKLKIIMKFQH